MKTENEIDDLKDRALEGDQAAAFLLFKIAFDSAYCLKEVALKNPAILLPVTRVAALFPALIAPNKSKDGEHAQILKKCEVGKNSTFNAASTAAMKWETPAKKMAAVFYRAMVNMRNGLDKGTPELSAACKALPKPSREHFSEWNKVLTFMLPGYELIDNYPENLRATVANEDTPGRKVDAMKKAVSQAFKTLLPDS